MLTSKRFSRHLHKVREAFVYSVGDPDPDLQDPHVLGPPGSGMEKSRSEIQD
jgi:hypothetical protein